jgi:hypothetical protein
VAHTHQPGWSEQEALEYLALLSTVARWTEETEPPGYISSEFGELLSSSAVSGGAGFLPR